MAAPNTPGGKERSKYNSIKGGLYVNCLLTCTESCMYKEICPAFELIQNQAGSRTFVCTCVIEVLEYIRMMDFFERNPEYKGLDKKFIHEHIILSLRADRIRRYITLNAEMTDDGQICKAYALLDRIKSKLLKSMETIIYYTSNQR